MQPAEHIDLKNNQNATIEKSPGIYVVVSTQPSATNVYRFGEATTDVAYRIRHHGKICAEPNNISRDLQPYDPIMLWYLPDWPARRVNMAEIVMFSALEAQNHKAQNAVKYTSDKRKNKHGKFVSDKSNFVISDEFDWEKFKNRVDRELAAIWKLGE